MKKLSIKNIVEFRGKSDTGKKNFVNALMINSPKVSTESGGDYWVSCLSAISNGYKANSMQPITDKRIELEEKYAKTTYERTKAMYKRNINILYDYEGFDLKKWRPSKKIRFIKKHKDDAVLSIKGLPIQATPSHIFTFQKNDVEEVGAIWFIAKLNGFKKEELGMFTDILHRYLKTHFSKDYTVNSKYCIAVDVFNNIEVNFYQLEKSEISMILDPTLDEINKLM